MNMNQQKPMTQNLFTPVFDAQRSAIEQSHAMSHDVVEAQKASFGAFADVISASESVVEQNAELSKRAVHAYLDALEMNLPEDAANFDDVREMVDEGVDAATETQIESLESMIGAIEESEKAFDQLAEGYTEMVDSSFDSFLEVHEQVETNVATMAENVDEAAEEFDASA